MQTHGIFIVDFRPCDSFILLLLFVMLGVTFGGAPATGGAGLFGGGSSGFCNGSGALAPAPALSFNTSASTPTQKPFGSKRGKNA